MSSPMNLRNRRLNRAATFAEGSAPAPAPASSPSPQTLRRNSTLSDSVSEARNTIRSSTDELFFPRVAANSDRDDEESHWQSAPLGLALLPAIAGIFFQNGSAFVTDVTLLALAAVFLNWSVRLPWEWYRSARSIRRQHSFHAVPVELDSVQYASRVQTGAQVDTPADTPSEPQGNGATPEQTKSSPPGQKSPDLSTAAIRELQLHELAALASCFLFPLIGTWILHHIRSNLSRPSEGLVSNYNLTIFLLAAEIRPFAHLLKMVQARTLHLQRIVDSSRDDADNDEGDKIDPAKISDLSKRLEELEAHIAETAAARLSNPTHASNPNFPHEPTSPLSKETQESYQSLITNATSTFQSDIDALTRAVRKYEKRTTLMAHETEKRLQFLESMAREAISLAAAAQQQSLSEQDKKGMGRMTLTESAEPLVILAVEWMSRVVFLPLTIVASLFSMPVLAARKFGRILLGVVLGDQGRQDQKNTDRSPNRERARGSMGRYTSTSTKGKAPQTQTAEQAQTPMRKPVSAQQKRVKRERERERERASIFEED
ncbi:hypothetical protein BJY01DRAFT_75986 [Aspergillus pseudoustus]|uniref:Uncharacterized protein n=1 Tax=Aspergillus pseudoustus TaxID=1810923 RepID=A0ABR4J641_9EURO